MLCIHSVNLKMDISLFTPVNERVNSLNILDNLFLSWIDPIHERNSWYFVDETFVG